MADEGPGKRGALYIVLCSFISTPTGYVLHALFLPASSLAIAQGAPWVIGPLCMLAAGAAVSAAFWRCTRDADDKDWKPGMIWSWSAALLGCTAGYTVGAVVGECFQWHFLWVVALCYLMGPLLLYFEGHGQRKASEASESHLEALGRERSHLKTS